MVTRILLILLGVLLLGASASAVTPEERYAQAFAVLNVQCEPQCGMGISGTSEEKQALDALWTATQDWTVAFLQTNPAITTERLRTELFNHHGGNREDVAPGNVFVLAPGVYAFTASFGETGNIFLIQRRDGHFAKVWDIRQADASALPLLKAWRNDHAFNGCEKEDDSNRGLCGPLFSDKIRVLPPDQMGRPRFYLNATYAQYAETTVAGQLSIWSLDGTVPKPQWAKRYLYNFEDMSWHRDGALLKIRTTDWWHMFFACGSCVGRQMNWTLRIRPDGVDDLGMVPVVPELDAIDQLFYRVWKHQPADELANPEVLAVSAKMIAALQEDEAAIAKKYHEAIDPNYLSLGMLDGDPKAAVVRKGREVCLVTDNSGPIRVRFETRGGKLFATELAQFPQSDSETCPKTSP